MHASIHLLTTYLLSVFHVPRHRLHPPWWSKTKFPYANEFYREHTNLATSNYMIISLSIESSLPKKKKKKKQTYNGNFPTFLTNLCKPIFRYHLPCMKDCLDFKDSMIWNKPFWLDSLFQGNLYFQLRTPKPHGSVGRQAPIYGADYFVRHPITSE